MRIAADLSAVASEVRCRKRGCASCTGLQRHHKKHEAMWFGIWEERRRNDRMFAAFIQRYNEFRPEDVALVCEPHHSEIHLIYDRIIAADKRRTRKSLSKYTWREAKRLMRKLGAACDKWLEEVTPGITREELKRRRAGFTVQPEKG